MPHGDQRNAWLDAGGDTLKRGEALVIPEPFLDPEEFSRRILMEHFRRSPLIQQAIHERVMARVGRVLPPRSP